MRRFARTLLFAALATASVAASAVQPGFEKMQFQDWRIMIKEAHLAYERGKFDRAFELYTRNACAGDKSSQFALGTMYLMGEGTQPDALRALAWYASAAETNHADYVKAYKKLDGMIPAEHRATADAMSKKVLALYGKDATHVQCKKRAEIGTMIAELECKPPIDSRTSYVEAKLCE
jgi:TPR repeat protein